MSAVLWGMLEVKETVTLEAKQEEEIQCFTSFGFVFLDLPSFCLPLSCFPMESKG